ncbi:hypothetical protein BDB01DRAFT_782232 [Pilobolus umbonatus]|nr:hypothetical protein BDB01DRAFT_782232 [Pilobolus umbonatus]
MGPEERSRRRKRQIQAEAIPDIVAKALINDEENGYSVLSFSLEDMVYSVVMEEGMMKSCTCQDFRWNAIACKHIYLLARMQKSIQVFEGKLLTYLYIHCLTYLS